MSLSRRLLGKHVEQTPGRGNESDGMAKPTEFFCLVSPGMLARFTAGSVYAWHESRPSDQHVPCTMVDGLQPLHGANAAVQHPHCSQTAHPQAGATCPTTASLQPVGTFQELVARVTRGSPHAMGALDDTR